MKSDEVNINLIKAYVSKSCKIYKIWPLILTSKKQRRTYAFYVLDTQEELSEWQMSEYLSKLFSVDVIVVKKAFNELVEAEAIKIQRQQTGIPYTGYFRKKKQ